MQCMKFMTTWSQQVRITNEASVSATQNWMSRQYTWNNSKDRATTSISIATIKQHNRRIIFDEFYLKLRSSRNAVFSKGNQDSIDIFES